MFDICPIAIDEAKDNNINSDKIEITERFSAQDYVFDNAYTFNAIYIKWCLGYLSKYDQIEFLRKAKKALKNPLKRYNRFEGPASYIIILENIDDRPEGSKPITDKG